MRTCLGCRTTKNKKELIRIVRAPDGSVHADSTGKMNGRGAYICRDASCLMKAQKSGALGRSLKVEIPTDVYETLREEIGS